MEGRSLLLLFLSLPLVLLVLILQPIYSQATNHGGNAATDGSTLYGEGEAKPCRHIIRTAPLTEMTPQKVTSLDPSYEGAARPWGFEEPIESERLITHNVPSDTFFQKGDTIKLLIWNLNGQYNSSFLHTFKKLIKESNLILTQETLLAPSIIEFYEQSKPHWITGVSFLQNSIRKGVSIGSSFSIENNFTLKSPLREPLINTPKMALFFDIPIANSNQVIKVVNIHALNFVTAKSFEKHIEQALQRVQDHNGPLIFAGDFNNWTNKKKQILQELIKAQQLQQISFKDDSRMMKVDHIFIRGFSLIKAKIFETNESDHQPLLAELRML